MRNKRVLIIGGSSGIGLSIAKMANEQGAKVIIASKSAKEKEKKLLRENELKGCDFFSFDITNEKDIKTLLEKVGMVDHIAITVKSPIIQSSFISSNKLEVLKAFETKFWGQYNFAKIAYKYINSNGSIIFTSGTLSTHPHNGFSTMSIINGAIESMCKSIALELAPIRVNSVSPGFKTLKDMEDKVPLGLGKDTQIANAYLFLMQDSYTTGSIIVSDGGATLV